MAADRESSGPVPEQGYFHGPVNAQHNAMRQALAPLARIGHAVSAEVPGETKLTIHHVTAGEPVVLECEITVADARAAIAALRVGQPLSRETLKAGGAKEIDPVRGLTHEKKGG